MLLSQVSGRMCQHQRKLCREADPSKQPDSQEPAQRTHRSRCSPSHPSTLCGLRSPRVKVHPPDLQVAPPPSELGAGPWLCAALRNTSPSTMQPGKEWGKGGSVLPSHPTRTWGQRPALSRCSHIPKSTFDREWGQGEGRRATPGSASTWQTQTWRQP